MVKVSSSVLENQVKDLVNSIKQFSESRKELWQQVPYLALEADGRTGYNGHLARAYKEGYWGVEPRMSTFSTEGHYVVTIDLETGRLMHNYGIINSANDINIIAVATNLNNLDPVRVILMLTDWAAVPTLSCYNAEEQEKWREFLRKEYALNPHTYQRRRKAA